MKLVIKNEAGLALSRPSRTTSMVVPVEGKLRWDEGRTARPRHLHPREVLVPCGTHEIERIENPLVPGGEPWLVLRGSRIGAAESYIRRLVAATEGTTNGIQLVTDLTVRVLSNPDPRAVAA
jgi:hypothetical protein